MVSPSFIDVSTGKAVPFDERHNTLSYMAAEAVAAAMGGDPSYIPCRMGFIYGNSDTLPISDVITRNQTWAALLESLSNSGDDVVDVQVVNFSYPPTLGPGSDDSSGSSSDSASSGDYTNIRPNGSSAVTFHAVSNSQDLGALNKGVFLKGNYIYQCLLLGYHQGDYYIIARASLQQDGRYLAKPDGFEIALDWTVTFR
jgi:hypothetical protein